jgi:Piwi domain
MPWKVLPAHDKCLIIGIGQAHRMSGDTIEKFFAYCVATDSSGLYKKITVLGNSKSRTDYIDELRDSLTREFEKASSEKYTECTIHVPFRLRQDEMKALEDALNDVHLSNGDINFTVLKVNDQHRFFGYANNNSRVPIEGTIAYLSDNAVLLWFEGLKRPNDVIGKRVSGPVHVEFLWPKDSTGRKIQKDHLQDLFNLSGTNWRGFNARSTPISIYYCQIIARFLTEFPDQAARIAGAEQPWFL